MRLIRTVALLAAMAAAMPALAQGGADRGKSARALPPLPPPLPVQRHIQAGAAQMTRAMAVAIALRYAPPASDVEVFRTDDNGLAAYAVIFKTAGGFHEVLLDGQTGRVLASGESRHFSNAAAPGRLPPGLR